VTAQQTAVVLLGLADTIIVVFCGWLVWIVVRAVIDYRYRRRG
jgi:hypothetical protein